MHMQVVVFYCKSKIKNFITLFCEMQIMEKLVDIVNYLQQAILEAFGNNGMSLISYDEISK